MSLERIEGARLSNPGCFRVLKRASQHRRPRFSYPGSKPETETTYVCTSCSFGGLFFPTPSFASAAVLAIHPPPLLTPLIAFPPPTGDSGSATASALELEIAHHVSPGVVLQSLGRQQHVEPRLQRDFPVLQPGAPQPARGCRAGGAAGELHASVPQRKREGTDLSGKRHLCSFSRRRDVNHAIVHNYRWGRLLFVVYCFGAPPNTSPPRVTPAAV